MQPGGAETPPRIEVITAADPFAEVELIGRAIRAQVNAGVPPRKESGLCFLNRANICPFYMRSLPNRIYLGARPQPVCAIPPLWARRF